MKIEFPKLFLSAAIFVIGMSIGAFAMRVYDSANPPIVQAAVRQSRYDANPDYSLIDPILVVANNNSPDDAILNPLKKDIQEVADSAQNIGVATTSVYFRDINESTRFNINTNERYFPASLMKVPLMMAYYKLADEDQSLLQKKLVFDSSVDANEKQSIKPAVTLVRGNVYTVQELIEHMVKYSDNNAADLLVEELDHLKKPDFWNIIQDLGISDVDASNDYLTTRSYSLFFRVLYNASYLDREYSQRALALLTSTDFASGIRSAVPSTITVAQKFGEFNVQNTSGTVLKRELHDCGIVYFPNHPYVLCVMTKGTDAESMHKTIVTISKAAYDFQMSRYADK